MAVSTTTRLGVTRWTAGGDLFDRSQMDDSHLALENKAAAFIQGTSRPAAGAAYVGTLFWNTSISALSYCDGTTWTDLVAGSGGWGSPTTLAVGDVAADGVAETSSRSDHQHGMPAFGSPVSIASAASDGAAATLVRADHVHNIAAGAIASSNMFAAGVVNNAAIGPSAVAAAELAANAVDSTKIAAQAVDSSALAIDAVAQTNLQNNSVGAAEIIAGAVGTSELGSVYGSVTGVTVGGAGTAGAASTVSRSDHVHPVAAGTPVSIGVTNATGSASSFARSDHIHEITDMRSVAITGGQSGGSGGVITTTETSLRSLVITLPTGWSTADLQMWGTIQAVQASGSPQVQGRFKHGTSVGWLAQTGVLGTAKAGVCTVGALFYGIASGSTLYLNGWLTAGTATLKYSNFTYLLLRTS